MTAASEPSRPMPSSPVPSPCINVCRMDEATGWCAGCLRTLDEIAAWATLDDATRRKVRVELDRRRVEWRRRQAEPAAAPGNGAGQ